MKARTDPSRIEEFLNNAEKLILFFCDLIIENGKIIKQWMIGEFAEEPHMENPHENLTDNQRQKKAQCVLTAYLIWACGAYAQKQRVFARSDRNYFLRAIWDRAHRTLDSQNLNLYFETVRHYEKDKFRQGAKVIELILEIYDIVNDRLWFDDQVALIRETLPLAEFFLGCNLAIIEKHFRPELMYEKTRDFYQYLALVEQNYKIDKSKLKQIAGV